VRDVVEVALFTDDAEASAYLRGPDGRLVELSG